MTEPIVTVAVDAMGGDHAPAAVVEGVTAALAADPQLVVLLVGPEDVVIPHASERCRPVVATEVIDMGEHPARAVRAMRDSSIVVGSRLVQEAFALLSTQTPGFIGNAEGRDIVWGVADVIVTDGFTGNVALKTIEGLASMLFTEMKRALTATVARRLAAVVVGPVVRELRSQIDPDAYGGAPLLGVSGVCIIGHGRSNARAVRNGIGVAVRAARGGLTARITDGLQRQAADA